MENQLGGGGHGIAAARMGAKLNVAGWISEDMGGVREICLINTTADGKNLSNTEKLASKFLDVLPCKSLVERASWNARLPSNNEAILIPTQDERQMRREEILTSLKDFKEFADAIDAVKDKGVAVAVASPDDVITANKECSNFFQLKKAL